MFQVNYLIKLEPTKTIYTLSMDGIQPCIESGGGNTIRLGSEMKYEPKSGEQNEYETDPLTVKAECFKESEERSVPIDIKNELDYNEHETISQNIKVHKTI